MKLNEFIQDPIFTTMLNKSIIKIIQGNYAYKIKGNSKYLIELIKPYLYKEIEEIDKINEVIEIIIEE